MNISELLSSPSMIHAAIVHTPIAAAFFGLMLIIISAIFHRNNSVRAITALMFVILVVSAYVAIETGEDARELVPSEMPRAVWDQLTAHSKSAETVLYGGIFTLACVLLSLVRVDVVRKVALLIAAVGAVATNIFVANTGHLGGSLVYNHGVGTPFAHQPVVEPVTETGEVPPLQIEVAPTPVDPNAVPAPAETEPVPAPVEPMPEAAAPAPVMDNPDWLPIREFTMEEAEKVSFTRDVWPIIDDQCITCHENPDADGDYDMTTVENMLKGGKKGGLGVVPGKPDESAIIKYIRGIANPRMPEDEPPLPDEMLHTLRMWIAAGAKDDGNAAVSESPEAVMIEVVEGVVESTPETAPEAAPEAAPETAPEVVAPEPAAPEASAPEASAPEAVPPATAAPELATPGTEPAPVEVPVVTEPTADEATVEVAPAA